MATMKHARDGLMDRPGSALAYRARVRCRASSRQQKNPKIFSNMDEAREYLHKQASGPSLAGALNWLSNAAFGGNVQQEGWGVGRIVQLFLTGSRAHSSGASLPQHPITSEAMRLAALLLCSPATAAQVIHNCPQVLQQGPTQVVLRLTALKQALPDVDLSILVARAPHRFLLGDSSSTCHQAAAAYTTLQQGLPGADVACMVQEDPELLFVELQSGIDELHDLWPVDAAALAASEPPQLGLAVRALSREGPPRRF